MLTEKFSSLDYKVQAVMKLIEGALDFAANQNIKEQIVNRIINSLNKKFLKGRYYLSLEECENQELLKNSASTIQNLIPSYLKLHENSNIQLLNHVSRELYNSSDTYTQDCLTFLDLLDSIYLDNKYADLVLANNTEKDRVELKKEMMERGLEKFLPMSLIDTVDFYLEEIIDILATKSYNMAKEKGFHTDEENEKDPKNLGNSIAKHGMNLIGEVVELWEAFRKGKLEEPCDKSAELKNFDEELADAQIRLWDTAKTFGRNLGQSVRLKWEINKKRPHRNGGKLA